MHEARSPRLLPVTSLVLASAALGLAAWTACQRHRSPDEGLAGSAVAGEQIVLARSAEQPSPIDSENTRSERAADQGTKGPSSARAPEQPRTGAFEPDNRKKPDAGTSDEVPLVKRLVLARGVENREPLALAGNAQTGEPLTAFVELSHEGDTPRVVVVTFEHEGGQKVGFVELEVPAASSRHRTWARTQNIKRSGNWQAVVTLKDGAELARQDFTVAEATIAEPEAS